MAAAAGRRSCASRARSARIAQVGLDGLLDVGALDLDDDLGPVGQHGRVHLTQGSRRNRGRIDNEKQLVEGAAQLRLDGGLDLVPGRRRDVVLQAGQLVDELGRKHIRPGAGDLAELDEGRPQLLDRLPQVDCGCLAGDGLLGVRRQASAQVQRLIEAKLGDDRAEAVPHQHFGYSTIAPEIARAESQHRVISTSLLDNCTIR